MYYIKNKTNEVLQMFFLSIELQPNEVRNIFEFTTMDRLQNSSSALVDLVIENKIILLNGNLEELSVTETIQVIVGSFQTVFVKNELNSDDSIYYFVTDEIKARDTTITKTFLGRVDSVQIKSSKDIKLQIKNNGLILPKLKIKEKQQINLEFNGKLINPEFDLILDKPATDIEIFIDGYSTKPISEIQQFINGWA